MSKHILVIGVSPGQVSEPIKMCVMVAAFSEVLCPVFHLCWCKHAYLFFFGNLLFIGIDWLYMIESILILLNFNLSLNHYQGGGSNYPNQIIMIKSLQMIVRLTSNLSLPVV